MARTITRTNDAFNEFLLAEFEATVPDVKVAAAGTVAAFLGTSEPAARNWIARWRNLHSQSAPGRSPEELRGHRWKIREDAVQLLHDELSRRRRKALLDRFADRRRRLGDCAKSRPFRMSSMSHVRLVAAVETVGHAHTLSSVLDCLIERHLDDLVKEICSSEIPSDCTGGRVGVSPTESIGEDAVVCLECGWQGVYLTRHLHKSHNLSAELYKAKWKMPATWNMVPKSFKRRIS